MIMPWTATDAESHTKKADTPAKQKAWAEVANKALEAGDDDASAIKQANAAVAHMNIVTTTEVRQPPKNGNGKNGNGGKGKNGDEDEDEDEDDGQSARGT